jgi:hypothetical protein
VIIVGDAGSGKHDVAKGADICVPFKTFGVSIGKKTNVDKRINYKLTLIFWTLTEGRPRETTYFHGAGAAIIVGDLDSRHSIKRMRNWVGTIRDYVGEIPLFFVGTKHNSKRHRKYTHLEKLAHDFNGKYFLLARNQEGALKTILKSIAKHIGNDYFKLLKSNQITPT